MKKVIKRLPERKKLNNAGSAMIMALTVISMIAILGIMALGTALLNVKMRDLNRRSDKNFYYLETALDEIYAQTGRMASEILKKNYVEVMGNLYKDDYRTNDEANKQLKRGFISDLTGNSSAETEKGMLGITIPQTEENAEENRKNAAETLASFSDTIQEQDLKVSVEAVILEEETAGAEDEMTSWESGKISGLFPLSSEKIYSGITLKGLSLIYTNPESGIESALTVDLRIKAPYVRFMNEGDALLDYVMAANGDIKVNVNGGSQTKNQFSGNIYGGSITVSHSETEAAGRLITSKGTLTADNGAELVISPEFDTGAQSRVWAGGILLNFSSSLSAADASFFVKDDLTLTGDGNRAVLNGNYYGYGNEGDSSMLETSAPGKSSAIIINDRGSTLDMSRLDTLMLAGRAYMRFDKTITNGQYVYPMGESLAVKATQTIYLIPESSISLSLAGGAADVNAGRAGSNPVLLPDSSEAYTLALHIELPEEMGGEKAEYLIQVSNPAGESDTGKGITITGPDAENSPVLPVILNGKIYLYYNFDTETERREFFIHYLENNGSSFDALLQKSRITGKNTGENGEDGGILIENESNSAQIHTSGALYQVAGESGDGEHLFQLLRKGQDGVSSNLEWINLIGNLNASFKNLQINLAETDRVGSRTSEADTGLSAVLPVGNYVRLDEVAKLTGEPVFLEEEGCSVLLSGDEVKVRLNGGTASVTTLGRTYSMDGGLIVSSKDITLEGSGSFNGLFLAEGAISVMGNADLTADGRTYEPILANDKVAGYFYDYSDAASTVLNDYEGFVTRENWSRSGREQEGGK